jgi:hypothetical protein
MISYITDIFNIYKSRRGRFISYALGPYLVLYITDAWTTELTPYKCF